jgi:hypothetical protein
MILLLSSACRQHAQFQPTQNTTAVSPSGQPAASYDLRVDQATESRITVNVWSDGVQRSDNRTTARIGLEIRNTGEEPVELDNAALSLETFDSRGAPLPATRHERLDAEKGSTTVPPRTASAFHLRFVLGVPIAPSQLGAMRLRWGVVRDGHDRYVQFTDFRQPEPVASAVTVFYTPVFGFYDPFFYGAPYGFHLNYFVPVRRVIVDRRSRR